MDEKTMDEIRSDYAFFESQFFIGETGLLCLYRLAWFFIGSLILSAIVKRGQSIWSSVSAIGWFCIVVFLGACYKTSFIFYLLGFASLYVISYSLLRLGGWEYSKEKKRALMFMTSMAPSIFHASFLASLTGYQVFTQSYKLDASNSVSQIQIMTLCMAYMICDGVFVLFFMREDFSFLLHHCACSVYMATCIVYEYGGMSFCVCCLLGECTTAFQNVWVIASECKSQRLYDKIMIFYPPFWLLVRFCIGPVVVGHMALFFIGGFYSNPLPYPIVFAWSALAIAVVCGSIPFGRKLFSEYSVWIRYGNDLHNTKVKAL